MFKGSYFATRTERRKGKSRNIAREVRTILEKNTTGSTLPRQHERPLESTRASRSVITHGISAVASGRGGVVDLGVFARTRRSIAVIIHEEICSRLLDLLELIWHLQAEAAAKHVAAVNSALEANEPQMCFKPVALEELAHSSEANVAAAEVVAVRRMNCRVSKTLRRA